LKAKEVKKRDSMPKSVLKTSTLKKEVEIRVLEATPTVGSPSDPRELSLNPREESVEGRGQAPVIDDAQQIREQSPLSSSPEKISFVDIDDEACEARSKAEQRDLPGKALQPFAELFEEAIDKKNQMVREVKEKTDEILAKQQAKKQQKEKMKEEKEKAEQEKEKVAQAVPVIENLNNFAYMVSVNFSMIKVQLIDIKRQKNSQAAT
jgi:vacuolar-type H+-ATPase subunit H